MRVTLNGSNYYRRSSIQAMQRGPGHCGASPMFLAIIRKRILKAKRLQAAQKHLAKVKS